MSLKIGSGLDRTDVVVGDCSLVLRDQGVVTRSKVPSKPIFSVHKPIGARKASSGMLSNEVNRIQRMKFATWSGFSVLGPSRVMNSSSGRPAR